MPHDDGTVACLASRHARPVPEAKKACALRPLLCAEREPFGGFKTLCASRGAILHYRRPQISGSVTIYDKACLKCSSTDQSHFTRRAFYLHASSQTRPKALVTTCTQHQLLRTTAALGASHSAARHTGERGSAQRGPRHGARPRHDERPSAQGMAHSTQRRHEEHTHHLPPTPHRRPHRSRHRHATDSRARYRHAKARPQHQNPKEREAAVANITLTGPA